MRTVLIAHLFYGDLLESSFSYLQNLPSVIDLVITTAPQNIDAVERLLARQHRRALAVLPAGTRGRDAGALLVAAHPYLLQYDVLGFVHDKKTTGGAGPADIGETFRELIWENLLGDEEVILRALAMFARTPDLGILTPPMPIENEYFLKLGRPWSHSRQAAQEVLQLLDVPYVLQECDVPRAVGNAFWCRTRALEKLFSYPFHYEDFPPEPLPLDGSLNHGIEHALSFIAQAAGYQTRTLLSRRGAALRCELQERILRQMCSFLAGKYYYAAFPGLMREMMQHTLQRFCGRFPRLFIYGAGYHGRRLLPLLARMGFAAEGFLVSDGYAVPADLLLPAAHLSEVSCALDTGIIVAASQGYRQAMARALYERGWQEEQCYFLM